MNRDQVIDAVRYIMQGPRAFELERLDRICEAVKPWDEWEAQRRVAMSGHAEEPSIGMMWRAQTNFLPLVLDVYSQAMKVDNYLSGSTKQTASPWKWWQRNKMVAKQTGIIRSVLQYGISYTTIMPSLNPLDEGKPGAYIRAVSPRQMTCLYGEPVEWEPGVTPVDDDWPIIALEMKGQAIRLYDEEFVHFIGVKQIPHSALGWSDMLYGGVDNFEYLEKREHGVGVCPVVRYRDRWLLDGEEAFGIIEPLINIQARVDETTYEMSATQYFTAFAQRWVAGWRPQDEQQALAMAAGDVWYFSSKDVKVGQFSAGDMKGYLDAKATAIRDIAAISQTPAQNLGIDTLVNISEATLAGLEAGKDRKTAEIQTALGESFEQLLRTCAHITGDKSASLDYGAEVKWQDTTARSFAQMVDGLVKMVAGLDLPEELAWEMVPGATKEWVDRAIDLRDQQKQEMLNAPAQLPPPPGQPTRPGNPPQQQPQPPQPQQQPPKQ